MNTAFRPSTCSLNSMINGDKRRAESRERMRVHRELHPELISESNRRYREKHREKVIAYARAYRAANKEKMASYKSTPEQAAKANERAAKWQTENRERARAIRRTRRARIANAPGKFSANEWLLLKAKYGFTCLCCGKTEPLIELIPDHVLPISKGGDNTIGNIQPLCQPCNNRKYVAHVDHRHEKRFA